MKSTIDTQKGKSNSTTVMVLIKSHEKRIKYEGKKKKDIFPWNLLLSDEDTHLRVVDGSSHLRFEIPN